MSEKMMLGCYIVEAAPAGWRVSRVSSDQIEPDEFQPVVHRRRNVALAYARASAALEEYLASLDAREDSAELFETWREADDRYETMAIEAGDAPKDGDVLTPRSAIASFAPVHRTHH